MEGWFAAQDETVWLEEKFVGVCKGLYNGEEARIMSDEGQLRWFGIKGRFRQGCPLSPTLFNLYESGNGYCVMVVEHSVSDYYESMSEVIIQT